MKIKTIAALLSCWVVLLCLPGCGRKPYAGRYKIVLVHSYEAGYPDAGRTREMLSDALARHGISCQGKRAVRLRREDYAAYDLLLGMDRWNLRHMERMLDGDPEGKIHLLMEFSKRPGEEIADPWYTGDFERTYQDVLESCQGLLAQVSPE